MEWLVVKEVIADYALRTGVSLVILFGASRLISFIARSVENIMLHVDVDDAAVGTLLRDLTRFALWVLTIAVILNILGLKEISIALGGSIALLGLGLAKSVADVAGNLIAGIFLILDEDFNVGARVKIDKVEGIIESLNIRKTKVRDAEGNLHIFPNKDVDGEVFVIKPADGDE